MAETNVSFFNPLTLNGKEVRDSSIEKVGTDLVGAALKEGREWGNTSDSRKRVYLGGAVRTYAFLSDVAGGMRFQSGATFAAGSYAAPSDAGIVGAIKNGYAWLIAGALSTGTILTAVGPTDTDRVDNGDVVVYVGADLTAVQVAALADWAGFNAIERDSNQTVTVVVPGVVLTADTDSSNTITGVTTIGAYEILDTASGQSVKGGIVSSVPITTPNVIVANSGVGMTVDLKVTGQI